MNTVQSHLMMAAGEIRQVLERLDESRTLCPHCTRETWANRNEFQAAQELRSMVAKLERWRSRLGDDA